MAVQFRTFPLNALTGKCNLTSDTVKATLHASAEAIGSNLDTLSVVNDLTHELATGAGYTSGGVTVANQTLTKQLANNWGKAWAASTAYALGQLVTTGGHILRCVTAGTSTTGAPTVGAIGGTITDGTVTWVYEGDGALTWVASTTPLVGHTIRPTTGNGYLYRVAAVTGNTGSTEPTWPTVVGETVTDGSVIWECVGTSVIVFACNNPSWASATFTGVQFVVFSDRTPSGASNQPLLAYIDYGTAQNGQGGAFTVQLNPEGLIFIFVP